ncbi:MAG: hypothetical protein ACI89X_000126 [Planctomycetota bacterium]|jgi:hypothetical protein
MTNPELRLDRISLSEAADQRITRSSNGVVACAPDLAADAVPQGSKRSSLVVCR